MLAKELKQVIWPTITFGPNDMHALHAPHNDPIVTQSKISKIIVYQVFVDTGTLGLEDRKHTQSNARDYKFKWEEMKNLRQLKCYHGYNAILGGPTLNAIKAIVMSYLLIIWMIVTMKVIWGLEDAQENAMRREKLIKQNYSSKEPSEESNNRGTNSFFHHCG
ncbi:hypothetical protein Cgig2_028755 [Carnegiea gigantea]|uniref:Uncharacterized protein n=1 Tax=Carnegiea gigantea TaxID=171969 RepID=A0A9Q1JQS2_9CARY|nr:hypothetical protein Cgig2_028755 [Carnegiea gigantea]